MILTDAGTRLWNKAIGVATLSLTPLYDRALIVKRILITAPSANDVWTISVNGRELARYQVNTTGNQQLVGSSEANYPKVKDIFEWYRSLVGPEFAYPVPLGMTITVASVGGATADVSMSYEEHTPGDLNPTMVNHPFTRHTILPVYGYRAAAVTAAGESALDSQIAPAWVPPIFTGVEVPTGWTIQILALFLEAAGRNTFSGSADHQSITDHLALQLDGQRMFTRNTAVLDGIPLVGAASATGSANTVFNGVLNSMPPFQESGVQDWNLLDVPIRLRGGSLPQWYLGATGDFTGGASYATTYMVALVDLVQA